MEVARQLSGGHQTTSTPKPQKARHKESSEFEPRKPRSYREPHSGREGRNRNFQEKENSKPAKIQTFAEMFGIEVTPPLAADSLFELERYFSEFDLSQELQDILKANKFVHPTKVQALSLPAALQGRNIFCSSETGSGKTLAFCIPMLERMRKGEIKQALILCPTREIAIQTQKILELLDTDIRYKSALVIGGLDMFVQKQALREYPPILVATPGRLIDVMKQGLVWLNYTDYVVLDEADRMLDMGFEPDLMQITEQLAGNQQTLLYSATMFPAVRKVAEKYGSNYEEITIGKPSTIAASVEHFIINVDSREKISVLKQILHRSTGKVIIFFNTIKETKEITEILNGAGMRDVSCIHSGKTQEQRQKVISDLREGHIRALLGTDVAARGIDVPNVELVVNCGLPNNPEEYIHRVGRTGRAGVKGIAVTLFSKRDERYLEPIEKMINLKIKVRKSI